MIYEFLLSQQTVKRSMNRSDSQGTAVFTVVRAGVERDVTVQWSLGPEAAKDFYEPLFGSLLFPSVIEQAAQWFLVTHVHSVHVKPCHTITVHCESPLVCQLTICVFVWVTVMGFVVWVFHSSDRRNFEVSLMTITCVRNTKIYNNNGSICP